MTVFLPPEGEHEKHAYHSPLEKKIKKYLSPFEAFTDKQITASIFLVLFTLIALVWASLPHYGQVYEQLVEMHIGFHIGDAVFSESVRYWVNDILLSLFFFFVGLEIKREFLVGELKQKKKAILVVICALGGMMFPALIYAAINYGKESMNGWGIPLATDTAFALGLLALFKHKVSRTLIMFIAAMAIVDDICSILVIAVFYSEKLMHIYLIGAVACVGLLSFFNFAGIRTAFPYIVIGIVTWACIEFAGLHGTLAGIVVAFTIPARPRKGPAHLLRSTRTLLNIFESRQQKRTILNDDAQHRILRKMKEAAEDGTTPLQRWQENLSYPITLLVLPIFALTNAGIPIDFTLLSHALTSPISLGIFFGLVLGKPIGITLFAYLGKLINIGEMPNCTLKQLFSVACIAGIGFTMSLFIANLSFESNETNLMIAKIGIVFGSLIAASLGVLIISRCSKFEK